MSILKVTRFGHPVLRKVTAIIPAEELQFPGMQEFIDDMIETMKDYDGVGLAADQVFESKQIAVLEVSENPRYPQKPKVPLTVLVNPRITPLSEDMEDDWEGCLSIPDLRGRVPRYKTIRVQALDRDGNAARLCCRRFSCPRHPTRIRSSQRQSLPRSHARFFHPHFLAGICPLLVANVTPPLPRRD